jgi:uncharacterized membrane protein
MEPPTEPTAILQRPKEATLAIKLLFASLGIGLLRGLAGLMLKPSGAMILAALIVIAIFTLGFFMVWKISAGRNWARIILLVLVVINLPFAALANVAELKRSVLSGALSIIIEVLIWIGTYLLFTKNSNLWFKNRK